MDDRRDQRSRALGVSDIGPDMGLWLSEALGKRHAYLAGSLYLQKPADCQSLACHDLLQPDCFATLMQRFASGYGVEADQRALVSYWSLHYLSTLVIAAGLAAVELRLALPFHLENMQLLLCEKTTTVKGFLLAETSVVLPESDVEKAFAPLLSGHLERIIPVMAKASGLSPKVFWANAAVYLSWVLSETGNHCGQDLEAKGRVLLDQPLRGDGGRNFMHKLIKVTRDAKGEYCGHRRVCCLRYAVPGVACCGEICPVEEGRGRVA